MTIRQIPAGGSADINDHIDLTPAPLINEYSNIGPNGEILDPEPVRKKHPPPKKPPRPPELMNGSMLFDNENVLPTAKPRVLAKPSRLKQASHPPIGARVGVHQEDDLYGNREVERAVALKDGKIRLDSDGYEDADSLDNMRAAPPVKSHTPAGTYDNPDEIIVSFAGDRRDNVYDIAEQNESELYEDAGSNNQKFQTPLSPKFDDVIYMKQGESPVPTPCAPVVMKKPPTKRKPVTALGNMSELTVGDHN